MTKFSKFFETKLRGEVPYITLTEDAPEWLKDAVRAAHGGDLPCDWVYEECSAAVEAFDEGENVEVSEHADSRVDVYTKSLYHWAAEMCGSRIFSEAEECGGGGESRDATLVDRIRLVQYYAIEAIAGAMFEACTDHEEDAEDGAQ